MVQPRSHRHTVPCVPHAARCASGRVVHQAMVARPSTAQRTKPVGRRHARPCAHHHASHHTRSPCACACVRAGAWWASAPWRTGTCRSPPRRLPCSRSTCARCCRATGATWWVLLVPQACLCIPRTCPGRVPHTLRPPLPCPALPCPALPCLTPLQPSLVPALAWTTHRAELGHARRWSPMMALSWPRSASTRAR